MSLQVRPGYVNPLTMMNKNNPIQKQTGNSPDETSDKLAELRAKQQALQNEILIMQSTGTDSATNTSEKVETLQKQLESISSEIRAAQNVGSDSEANSALSDGALAVKISISPEGMQSYRNSLIGKSESYDNVLARKDELLSKKEPFIRDYRSAFELQFVGGKKTTEEIASDLFQRYTEKYDEIVQGYQSGERVSYAADSESDTGYHQMTMSEELEALTDAYQVYVDNLEKQVQQIPENIKALESIQNTQSRLFGASDERALKTKDAISRLKNDVIPENMHEKMIAAAKKFVEQYPRQQDINIFHQNSDNT